MQTLVMVPAMIRVLRPVALTAATNSGLSQALISPRRDVLRVGRVVVDLWNQWAVPGPAGRGDDGHLAQRGHAGQGGGAGAQLGHGHVAHGLEQAALVVDEQHGGVVGIDHGALAVEVGGVVMADSKEE